MDLTTFLLYNQPKDRDAPILIDADAPERTLSWYDYASAVKRISVGLRARGLANQDCVGLLSHNDIYYHVLAHGVIAAGGVFAAIPTSYTASELCRAISVAEIRVLFASLQFLELVLYGVKTLPAPKKPYILYFDPPGERSPHYIEGIECLSSLIYSADARRFKNMNSGADMARQTAYRLSTGCWPTATRAAEISHTTHLRRLMSAMRPPWPTDDKPRFSLQSSGMHNAATALATELAVVGEGTAYITRCRDNNGAKIIDMTQKLNITDLHLSIPDLSSVVDGLAGSGSKDVRVASLRRAVINGPVSKELLTAFRASLCDEAAIVICFGNAECWNFSMFEFDSKWKYGSMGRPCPGVQVRVSGPEEGEPLTAASEICVRGDKVMREYYKDPKSTAIRFEEAPDGRRWFRTGCYGWIDPATQLIYLDEDSDSPPFSLHLTEPSSSNADPSASVNED